jgi:hypothetical protein
MNKGNRVKTLMKRYWKSGLLQMYVHISSHGSCLPSASQCALFDKIIHANCGKAKGRVLFVNAIKAFGDVEV